jgi:hypothetical protein
MSKNRTEQIKYDPSFLSRKNRVGQIFKDMLQRNTQGDFLLSFAQAIIRADGDNFLLLWDVAEKLIDKYNLEEEYPVRL